MAGKPKYTMQIVNENGQIVKSETLSELWEGKERKITLLPSEKRLFKKTEDTGRGVLKKPVVDSILESRGLKEMIDEEEPTLDEDGILTITKKG